MLRPATLRPLLLRQAGPRPRPAHATKQWRALSQLHPTNERLPHPESSEPSEPRESQSVPPPATANSPSISEDSSAPRPSTSTSPSLDTIIPVDELKVKLRTLSESAAIAIRERADKYTASAATTFAQLGRELNKVTGYGEIESLKRQVVDQEARIKAAREAARDAKQAYDHAVRQRANSQREVNDLLQRKSSWTDDDVLRFTALVRQDHLHEQAEARAKADAAATEDDVEREFTELMRVILSRYHEEQVWSDKIRSASTYGSLTVLGLNMLVFVLAILIVEPWKRRRLAQTFEKKVEEMATETVAAFEAKTESLMGRLQEQDRVMAQLVEAVTYSLQPVPLSIPQEEDHDDVPALPAEQTPLESDGTYKELYLVVISSSIASAVGWLASTWWRG